MPKTMTFFFDFVSPYVYLAHQKLPELAERFGYAIEYRPIDLKAAKLSAGNTGPANRDVPVKYRYLLADLRRWAGLYGVPLVPPPKRNSDSKRLNCGTFFAVDRGMTRAYVDRVCHGIWGLGGAGDDDTLLESIAESMNWNVGEFLSYVSSDEALVRYNTSGNEANRLGVFGVPMTVIGEHMWWGNDRLGFVEDHLKTSVRQDGGSEP